MKEIDWEERHFQICLALLSNSKIMETGSSGAYVLKKAGEILKLLKKKETSEIEPKELVRSTIGDKWGFKDGHNKWIIDPIYDYLGDFFNDLAVASITISDEELYGYIDINDRFVIEPKFTKAYDFNKGVAFAADERELFGLIDKTGNWLHKPEFCEVFSFKDNGFARVRKDGSVGIYHWIGRTGNLYDNLPE